MYTRLHDYMASPTPPHAAVGRVGPEGKKVPLEFRKGIKGGDTIVLRGPRNSSAEVLLYGAQVISWKSQNGDELLFLSSKVASKVEYDDTGFLPPTPYILGGIQICFPHIQMFGPLDPPGLAEDILWNVDSSPPPLQTTSLSNVFVDLILPTNEADLQFGPHRFEYRLRVTLGILGELILTSRIKNVNTNERPFSFAFSYRNYLRVSNIRKVRIERLKRVEYIDKLKEMEQFTQQRDAITVKSEVDKLFLKPPAKIPITDNKKKHTIFIRRDGLPDVGVWNPWKEKAEQMGGFGENEYEKMVCVEPTLVDGIVTLKPGEEWRGEQELIFDSSPYNSNN